MSVGGMYSYCFVSVG